MTNPMNHIFIKRKFDHTNKWDMHNPEPVLENETHKLLWDSDIQTAHIISVRLPDLIIKLATLVEDVPKVPFSIATTPRCRGGRYTIPRIVPLYPRS